MMKKLLFAPLIASVLGLAGVAQATILTFDQDNPDGSGVGNFEVIDQTYGDNVVGEPDANNNGYDFGSEGITPNITVSYAGIDGASVDPSLWTTGYGSLTNVLFEDADFVGELEVRFEAEPGWLVQLLSFDMAAYTSLFSSDPTIDFVRVLDGEGNVLFDSPNQAISRTTFTPFDFTANPLEAEVIRLQFNSGNLGGVSDDIAFDNITFAQVVPEPATMSLFILGGLALMRRRTQR